MFGPIIIWIAKGLATFAINWLVKKIGHSNATAHVILTLQNAKPIKPDITPAQERDPNVTNHYE